MYISDKYSEDSLSVILHLMQWNNNHGKNNKKNDFCLYLILLFFCFCLFIPEKNASQWMYQLIDLIDLISYLKAEDTETN